MAELTGEELASRSGITPQIVQRLVGLKILAPGQGEAQFRASDVQRVRLVRALQESGISFEDIGRAVGDGHLSLEFVDSLFADPVSLSTTTYKELAEELGMTSEEFDRLQSALGLPHLAPDDQVPEDDLEIFRLWGATVSMDPDAVIRTTRVFGESLYKIAEAESRFWQVQVEEPMVRQGAPAQQIIDVSAQVGAQLQSVADRLVLLLHRRLMHRYTMQTFVARLQRVMAEAGVVPARPEHPPAIAFLDLSGFTTLTEQQGDEVAASLAQSFAEVVQETSRAHGGRLVKLLGDGAMFHFPETLGGVLCALELVDRVPGLGLPAARVGLHTGQVISQDGDYFGATVNIAARIADHARPGEILVTDDVVGACGRDAARFREIGPVSLKGVTDPVTLHTASRAG